MEYTALYRRFRPITFNQILGQDHIVTTLKNQVINNRVGHAYLFTGQRGCGKTTSAKVLARAVNCLNPKDGEPCNECEICKAALDGSLTDIVELDAASNNGVDNIRSIIEEVNFLPVSAKYRVYIIDEVHMLSTGAFNALLKTLEEPPAHVKFILCTTDPQKVPATIISRCLRFDFKRISDDFICQNLAQICTASKIKYTDDSLKLIAELSEGAMRDALTILERCAQDGENNIDVEKIKALAGIPEMSYIIDIVTNIANKDTDSLIKLLDDIIKEGKNTSNILWEVIKFLKDVLVFKATNTTSSRYSDKEKEQIKDIAEKMSKENLLNAIYSLSKLENDLKWSTQKDIMFEVGLLELASIDVVSTETKKVVEVQRAEPAKKAPEIKKESAKKEKESEEVIKLQADFAKDEVDMTHVIEALSEDMKFIMLKNALMNSKAYKLDDLNVGILPSQSGVVLLESALKEDEAKNKIKELIPIECKADMRVKVIKPTDLKKKQETKTPKVDLGIPINEIDG